MQPAGDPLVGWRYWQLTTDGRRLRSVSLRRFVWEPGRPLRASCATGAHPAPEEGCDCGIYAAIDLDALRRGGLCLSPGGVVVGQVDLWGTVVSGVDGHRGQYALPRSLALVEDTVPEPARLGALDALSAYGVGVTTTCLHEAVGELSGAVLAFQAMSLRVE